MALIINLSGYKNRKIYLGVNIDNTLLTWNIHFMDQHISNIDDKIIFELEAGLAAGLINKTYIFSMNYSNDSQMDLSFRLRLRWYYYNSGNKVYIDDAVHGDYPWPATADVKVGSNAFYEAEINFTG